MAVANYSAMKLSVVMPVYNEERTLREIVGRVLEQPFEKELILVDAADTECAASGQICNESKPRRGLQSGAPRHGEAKTRLGRTT